MIKAFKYLVVVLDSRLKFDKHVKKISKTIKNYLNCFKLIRHHIPIKSAQLYMHAMIFSHILYCVWSHASPGTIKLNASLYNQTLKIMAKKPIKWHQCHILKQYNLLSFDNFLKFVLCSLFSRQNSDRIIRGTASGNCKISCHKTSFGLSAFSIKGSQI